MRYDCGHEGCDLCGGRTCTGNNLKEYGGHILACRLCVDRALKFTLQASQTFSVFIDEREPCGRPPIPAPLTEDAAGREGE